MAPSSSNNGKVFLEIPRPKSVMSSWWWLTSREGEASQQYVYIHIHWNQSHIWLWHSPKIPKTPVSEKKHMGSFALDLWIFVLRDGMRPSVPRKNRATKKRVFWGFYYLSHVKEKNNWATIFPLRNERGSWCQMSWKITIFPRKYHHNGCCLYG